MTIISKFAGRCTRCGQHFAAGTAVIWTRGVRGATHETQADCDAARATAATAPADPVITAGGQVAEFLRGAQERGLTFPKARFLAPDGRSELTLSLAGASSHYPGAVQVKVSGQWVGRIERDGRLAGRTLTGDPSLIAILQRIADAPATMAREYGAVTSRCSFCNLPLTDEGSIEYGYGSVCARKYGLPHEHRGSRHLTAVPELTNELPPEPAPRHARGRRRLRQPSLIEGQCLNDDSTYIHTRRARGSSSRATGACSTNCHSRKTLEVTRHSIHRTALPDATH